MFNEKEVENYTKTFLKVFNSREKKFCVERLYSYLLSLGYCPIECTTSTMEYVLRETVLANDSRVSIIECSRDDDMGVYSYKFIFIDKEQAESAEELLRSVLWAIGTITLGHLEKRGHHIALEDREKEIDYFSGIILKSIKE